MNQDEFKRVAPLYDSPAGQLGPLLFGGHLHWGYWDEAHSDDDFATAAERLTQMMIERCRIGPGQRFVDLGCGVGLPAQRLAQATGCRVDGITISAYQQREATERAKNAGLQAQLRFIHGTALAIPGGEATYDGGWFFESIFHMGHRAALKESARVLKPGATLLLTDLPTLPHTTDEFLSFAEQHIHSSFLPLAHYPRLLEEAGFGLVEIEDITPNVMPWLVSKLREALELHADAVSAAMGGEVEKAVDDWLYLFEYMGENLGYVIVNARRL